MDSVTTKQIDDLTYEEKIKGRWLIETVNGRSTYYMSSTSTWDPDDMAAITIQRASDGKFVAFKNHHVGRSTPVKVHTDITQLMQWAEEYSPVRLHR